VTRTPSSPPSDTPSGTAPQTPPRAPLPGTPATPTRSSSRPLLRLLTLAAVLAAVGVIAWRLGVLDLRDPDTLMAAVDRVRRVPFLPVAFVLTYGVVAAFGLPATPFTLAGGVLFGTAAGSALNWTGAVIGATGTYLLGRRIGGDALPQLLGERRVILDALTGNAAFASLFRLRLLPVIPFNMLSLAASLAGVPLRQYVLATGLGIVPGTIIYTYFADRLLAGVAGASDAATQQLLVATVLLLALSFLPGIVRRVRRGGPGTEASR
jgi:uncharacterized membrane protein YdjX (TVP38/TMEM64 family)